MYSKIGRPERVKLEDVSFERQFEVFSDNQIEARYLLTTALWNECLKLKRPFRAKISSSVFLTTNC
ncbi:MAG: DUF3137 domain-containing protein [Alphaproteobacteria bacterium]